MGVRFFEHDLPRIADALERVANLLVAPEQAPPRTMTKESFEQELKDIENSFPFQNMLEYFSFMKDEPVHKVALIYHAFSVACSDTLFENPLTIGTLVNRCLEHPGAVCAIVGVARKTWGPR